MPQNESSCVEKAAGPLTGSKQETTVTTQPAKEEQKMSVMVGKAAPDFEATAFTGGQFTTARLSDYRGKWVALCFYPGDFTFVWPTELAAVAVNKENFDGLGVQVLAMSTDSHFTHKMWQEQELAKMVKGGFPYPMLADAGGRIGSVYGVYDEEAGVDVRGRFLVDPDGVVQAMEVLTPPVGRNVTEFIRQIKAFQHVRETGEATPAGWQPGKPTLTPGPDLVGKVWEVWSTDNLA